MLLSPGSFLGNYAASCADLTPDSECEIGAHYFGGEVPTGGVPGAITVQVFPSVVP
jgi:hypothetical protein